MSAGRVSKLVCPAAGRRSTANNNNNVDVCASLNRTAVVGRCDGGSHVQSPKSSKCCSTTSSSGGRRVPRCGGGEDYVSVQFVNVTQSRQTSPGHVDKQVHSVTSLEHHQQAIVDTHLQVSSAATVV